MRLGPDRRAIGVVRVTKGRVDGCGSGQHVSRVAEGGQVTHVGHVAGEARCAAEGRSLVLHALGELVEAVTSTLVPLGLAGHLAVACLDAFLLHGQGSVDLRKNGTAQSKGNKSLSDSAHYIGQGLFCC